MIERNAEAFVNRLAKNFRHLKKWAKREDVHCWRVYDRDLHDYNVAIDLYERWVHVQEYERPPRIDDARARARLEFVMETLPGALGVRPEDCFVKTRRRQRGGSQYEKLGERGELHEVREGGHTFLVSFTDYLDTGLFLDHRKTRAMLGEMARGKSFLNLFAYTGTATVYAACGGATSTTTVDMSNTYLEWAARNLRLNGIEPGADHELIRADCTLWIPAGGGEGGRRRWDVIFLDPPTFSTSKKMEGTFDVQRDHVALLRATARLLAPGGVLLFSNNFRRFRLDAKALPGLAIEDVTRRTIPEDFRRTEKVHHAFLVRRAGPP